MRRFFAVLGLAAASSLLAGCPVYSAESCVDSSDCASGFVCDGRRSECVALPSDDDARCSVSSDCGANSYCRQDGLCAPIDDCRFTGCPGGYVCEASSSTAAPHCVIGAATGGSAGKGGSSAGGATQAGGTSGEAGSAGAPEPGGAGGEPAGGASGQAGNAQGGNAQAGNTQGGNAGEAQGGAAQAGNGGAAQGGAESAGAGGNTAGAGGNTAGAGGSTAGAGGNTAGAGGSGAGGAATAGAGGGATAGAAGSASDPGGAAGSAGGATQPTCDSGGLTSASGSLQLVSQATSTACAGGLSSKPLEGKLAIAGGKGAPADTWTFEAVGVVASQSEILCNQDGVACSFSFQRTEGQSTTRYTSTAAPFTVKVTIWNDGSFIGTAEQVKTIRRVTVPGQTDQQVVEGVTLVMVATAN